MSLKRDVVLIGYSGHAYVVADIFVTKQRHVSAYCDFSEKKINPYNLKYLGWEQDEEVIQKLNNLDYFIAIGDNNIREKTYHFLQSSFAEPANAIHHTASVSKLTSLEKGIMVGPGAIINAQATIGRGVICNSGSVIEHECVIEEFAHIAPGAILGGNVKVGKNTLIGIGAVIKPNTVIGSNVIIGAGTVIIENIPSNSKVVGNPQRYI